MKKVHNRKDRTVSDIVGTLLIFSILVTLFTTFIAWYVPYSGNQYETQYHVSTLKSMSSLSNQLLSNSLQNNSHFSQSFPLGIQGNFFNSPAATSLSYLDSFSVAMHYNVSIQAVYSGNTPPSQLANQVIGSPIRVGNSPDGVAVDTVKIQGVYNNLIFVLNSNYSFDNSHPSTPKHGGITVISGATDYYNRPKGNISLLGYPTGITFDPKNDLLYVTEGNLSAGQFDFYNSPPTFQSGFVQVINANANKLSVVRTVYFSSVPYDITYIPYLDQVMFTIQFSDYNPNNYTGYGGAVVSFNATSYAETAFIPVAPLYSNIIPSSISYDPANGYVYVALGNFTSFFSRSYFLGVGIINPITDQIVGNIASSTPWSLAYDTSQGTIFVSESLISSYNQPYSNYNYSGGRTLFVLNGANGKVIKSYSYQFITPVSMTYDRSNHLVYVSDYGNDTVYAFNGINGTLNQVIKLPHAGPGNGPNAMAWDPLNGQIYVPDWNSGTLTVISGSTSITNQFSSADNNFRPVNTLKGSGQLQAYGVTPFAQEQYYDLQSGYVVQQGIGGSFGQILNGLPFAITGTAGVVSLDSSIVNIQGTPFSVSQSGNYILSGKVISMDKQSWATGLVLNFLYLGKEYSATVSSISLNNFSFSINSGAIAAWNYSLYSKYNSTSAPYNSNPVNSSWQFSTLPFKVRISNGAIQIYSTKQIFLQTFQYDFLAILLNS